MRSMRYVLPVLMLIVFYCAGCAAPPAPIAYLAAQKPDGVIKAEEHTLLKKEFPRGGWYFWNYNFRPAADVASYVDQAGQTAGTSVLRNADVRLEVPFAFDILFFGYNKGTDSVTAKGR